MTSKRQVLFLFPSVSRTMELLLFCSLLCVLHDLAHADPPYDDPPYSNCSITTFTDKSLFQSRLSDLLLSLSSNASASNFYNTSIGNDTDIVYGLFLCYKYVPSGDCHNCISAATEDIKKFCPTSNEAVVWEEKCQLRYSNERFFGHLNATKNIQQNNIKNVTDPHRFRSVVNDTLHNLTKRAAFDPSTCMYATVAVPFPDAETIYALVQCTIDLSPDDCNTCLEIAINETLAVYFFSRGARLLSRSCYLRYEFYPFYEVVSANSTQNQGADSTRNQNSESGGRRNKWMIIVLAIGSAILMIAFLSFCVYCLALRNQTKKRESIISSQEAQLHDIGDLNNIDFLNQNSQGGDNLNSKDHLFIDMETINAATDNFADSHKLGQGGFGPVYKGILPDGTEVAVKRLSSCSEQGSDEFVNEVLLIFKLQHKNLVKLLGFCVHGEEKLLIYEYMPNSSLDVFLFDRRKCKQLNWSIRLNIINGIARGMLYLHQDSRLRIIHRDLKPSNVLLDGDMNPKISDFGMARIYGGNDCEVNTAKIVGTYGYIAPEFAMEGLYSIKSDVFSFGVLLLEIITGRKNAGFHLSKCAPSLLAFVWQLWNEGKGLELMDPLLADSCCVDEFLRCMHIGLLCVQEDAYDRPTMSSVVVMLKSEPVTLCQPEKPAFYVGRITDHHEACYNNLSINGVTVSDILPQ